jgi:hypothetical protein
MRLKTIEVESCAESSALPLAAPGLTVAWATEFLDLVSGLMSVGCPDIYQ